MFTPGEPQSPSTAWALLTPAFQIQTSCQTLSCKISTQWYTWKFKRWGCYLYRAQDYQHSLLRRYSVGQYWSLNLLCFQVPSSCFAGLVLSLWWVSLLHDWDDSLKPDICPSFHYIANKYIIFLWWARVTFFFFTSICFLENADKYALDILHIFFFYFKVIVPLRACE